MIKELKDNVNALEISIEHIVIDNKLLIKMSEIFKEIKAANINMIFSFVVTNENRPLLIEALKLAQKYDAYFTYRIVQPIGKAEKYYDEFEPQKHYKWSIDIMIDILNYLVENKLFKSKLLKCIKTDLIPQQYCGAYGNILAIQPNGDISPCGNISATRMTLGNVKKNNYYQIMDNISEFRKRNDAKERFCVQYKKQCKDCLYEYFCNGFCGAIQIYDLELERKYNQYNCQLKKTLLYFEMFIKEADWNMCLR